MKNEYKILAQRILKILLGFFIIGLGNALSLKANFGMSAWSTLDHGLSLTFNMTFGTAVSLTALVILLIDMALGMIPGIGTILNMLSIGVFSDICSWLLSAISFDSLALRIVFLVFGLVFHGIGCAYYISIKLGSGPRDSLSLLLSQRFKLDFVKLRIALEISAIFVGYILGATVGIGTVLAGFLSGPIVGKALKYFSYNPAVDKQENIFQTLKSLSK
ncbi:MAG: hypothetical protein Q4E36_04575 [Bacillota bacterium]|nr:hypothetical protein [Bacillota bacterium]